MKTITESRITDLVSDLCIRANLYLRRDVERSLKKALVRETHGGAKKILEKLLENARVARREKLPLCQDTGLAVVFVELGGGVDLSKVRVGKAIQKGVREGYQKGYLRRSIITDPLLRDKTPGFSPCVIHYALTRKRGLKIKVMVKGFGCENKTQLKMFHPTASLIEIKDFVVSCVKEAGPDACPPYVIGVGIGGTADYAALRSKMALLRPLDQKSRLAHVARLEQEIFKDINALNIGPMGLGGRITALGVSILTDPTHIAGLPVAVNVSCHVLRSAHGCLR